MQKCDVCGTELIEAQVEGQHPFELGVDGESEIYISYTNGTIEKKSLLGKLKQVANYKRQLLHARVCPKCGKVIFYVDPNQNY